MSEKKLLYKRLIATVVAGALYSTATAGFAQTTLKPEVQLPQGRQFYGGDSAFVGLIRVHILGGVASPGKYYISPQTDLLELVSIAGGITPQADLEKIQLRRRDGIPEKNYTLNLHHAMEVVDFQPVYFKDNDVLMINSKEQLISPEVVSIVSFTSSILATVVTLLLLNDRLQQKK
jgi:hypothetical protein